MAPPPNENRAVGYIAAGWPLTAIAVVAILLRLYSRLFVTKSAGADDLTIVFVLPLTILGEILDTLAFAAGLGRHDQYLSPTQLSEVLKYEYILWIVVFLSFFFIRASIMFFTLRLLPATKVWAARFTLFAFFLNFAITVIATVSWGVKCIPFPAIYGAAAAKWCEGPEVTIATQKLNGILASVIDIATALVPAFLLWNIQIKRQTKVILDVIFMLGLVTAGLSVGRAVTFHDDTFQNDTSYRIITPSIISLVEEKAGIIFACCPALRQLFVHFMRNGSLSPARRRQSSNEDFHKMRTKVKLRDLFWYKKPSQSSLTTISGKPIYPPETFIDRRTRRHAENEGKKSPLDMFSIIFRPYGGRKAFLGLHSDDDQLPTTRDGSSDSPQRRSRNKPWQWRWSSKANESQDASGYRSNAPLTQYRSATRNDSVASPASIPSSDSHTMEVYLDKDLTPHTSHSPSPSAPRDRRTRSIDELTRHLSEINLVREERPLTQLYTGGDQRHEHERTQPSESAELIVQGVQETADLPDDHKPSQSSGESQLTLSSAAYQKP